MLWQRKPLPRRGSRWRARPRALILAAAFVPATALLSITLTACAPEPTVEEPAQQTQSESAADSPSGTASKSPEEPVEDLVEEPVTEVVQAPAPTDCGWDTPALAPDLGKIPSGQEGALSDVLPGAWQHVAYDEGAGYTDDLTADIRYVFPSTSELIYCQDVPGVTDQAENRAAVQLEGTEIVLPAPATGYAVQSWSQDAMVWVNHRDGSLYLLQRR